MARSLTAYLKRSDVPERAALQQAIDALKFKATLDADYAPFETSGYLPCTLDGEDAGFDLRFRNVAADLPPTVQAGLSGRDVALALKWSGDPREEMAALVFCAALVGNFDAVVQEGDADGFLSTEQLIAKAEAAQE